MVNMNKSTSRRGPLEIDSLNPHALVSFRAIVAGLLIVMFTFVGLTGLGLALGGLGLDAVTAIGTATLFKNLWFMMSVLLSLFVGSYFAARISKFRTGRVGSLQGLVIAALFMGVFFFEALSAFTPLGSSSGSSLTKSDIGLTSWMFGKSSSLPISNAVTRLTEDTLGDLNLRSGSQLVAQGLATRLTLGEVESAKNYLSLQAGIPLTEAETRILEMKPLLEKSLAEEKEASLTALRSFGRLLFLLVALGSLATIAGGSLGSVVNFRRPLVRENDQDYVYS
jgi:hypothetical protein